MRDSMTLRAALVNHNNATHAQPASQAEVEATTHPGAATRGNSAAIKRWPASELPAEDYVLRVGGGVQHAS